MKNNVSITLMVNEILTLLKDPKSSYVQQTIHEYELSFGIILSHLNSKGIFMYDKASFNTNCWELYNDGELSKTRDSHIHVALNQLDYYFKHHALKPKNYSHSRLE